MHQGIQVLRLEDGGMPIRIPGSTLLAAKAIPTFSVVGFEVMAATLMGSNMGTPRGLRTLSQWGHACPLLLCLSILVACGGGSGNSNHNGDNDNDPPLIQAHYLAVADTGSHRVLIYNFPFTTNQNASVVLGQPDFTTATKAISETGMSSPTAVALDSSGNLYVVDGGDSGANRVLQFKPPFTNGMSATLVIGQPDFVTGLASLSQNGLDKPFGLAFDRGGNLWVSDACRVLEYQPPFSTHMDASLVIGEKDFTSCDFGISSSSFYSALGIAFDSGGNLWVADDFRVLEFQPPFTRGMGANLVIGQPEFVSAGQATTVSGLRSPHNVAFDKTGNLWVSDLGNYRVLQYKPPFSNGMNASLVLGQSTFTTREFATTANRLSRNIGIAFDTVGNLWVGDMDNNRTLEFSPPFSSGQNATLVLGQADFASSGAATTESGETFPFGVTPF